MIPTREQVFAALWARVSAATIGGNPAFVTKDRTVLPWDAVPSELYPCLFMAKGSEQIARVRGLPPKITMNALLYIYAITNAQSDDSAASPSEILNPLLDAIDAALAPDSNETNTCTLGGIVSHAWISGEIMTTEGALGNIEAALVPIEVLVPTLVNQ